MSEHDFSQFSKLSPFELKDRLIDIASSDTQILMLNAGRGNPNFLATLPRWAFLSLGDFAMHEAERSYSYLNSGFGGLPEREGIVQRFEAYANLHRGTDGVNFLCTAISYVKDQLGLSRDAFLYEMVGAFLGCNYPTPPRMLAHTEEIVKAYLTQEMFGTQPRAGEFSVFATEGGTAAMAYIFQSLRANGLVKPGDLKSKAETNNPFADVGRMIRQFKVPGLDMAPIIESRRKDMEALVEANNATHDAMQAPARKQTEILSPVCAFVYILPNTLASAQPVSKPT